jgi:hypothetical protein
MDLGESLANLGFMISRQRVIGKSLFFTQQKPHWWPKRNIQLPNQGLRSLKSTAFARGCGRYFFASWILWCSLDWWCLTWMSWNVHCFLLLQFWYVNDARCVFPARKIYVDAFKWHSEMISHKKQLRLPCFIETCYVGSCGSSQKFLFKQNHVMPLKPILKWQFFFKDFPTKLFSANLPSGKLYNIAIENGHRNSEFSH